MQGIVSEITIMAEDMHRITVQMPADTPFIYKPGDYVFLTVAGYDPRPYSIANAPRDNNSIDFYIKKNPHGTSGALCDTLTVCDPIAISAPYHQFDFPNDDAPVDFVTGGMGITPFLGMIESYRQGQPKLRLYWGVETENDLYFMPFLEEQRLRLGNTFDIIVTIAKRDGNIMDAYFTSFDPAQKNHVYLSGPRGMILAGVERLLANGVEQHMIHYDVPTS